MAAHPTCPECRPASVVPSNHESHGQEAITMSDSRAASPETERSSPTVYNPYYTGRPRTPASASGSGSINRQEIIRRIKSGQSRPTSPELGRPPLNEYSRLAQVKSKDSRSTSPDRESPGSRGYERKRKSPVESEARSIPSDASPASVDVQNSNYASGMQIERPRSALHRGDFREKQQSPPSADTLGSRSPIREERPSVFATSPVAPWHTSFPAAARSQACGNEQRQLVPIPSRARAISNASLSASFVYKAPTSPLVQSSRPDTPEPPPHQLSGSPDKNRRHTFSPTSFQRFQSALNYPTTARVAPPIRSEKTFPYQAHQPRRSLNSASFASLPHSPANGTRPPSISESPLHHAPLVGSYEESILRGRMSTTPSKPLNFVAQIGVLGRGNCKSSLRCPPHVQIPFPAVFYHYGSQTKTPADQPSPYVGLVDLENNLPSQESAQDRRRKLVQDTVSNAESRNSSPSREAGSGSEAKLRRRQKQKRRSGSPKAPPGGSYRIPQQGQLQIVLKNPNKTAVKLFLVAYDLSDMEPGQKTFIRQRSYSAGPIIDMPLSSRPNLGTDRPEASLNPTGDLNDKPTLRYLIHLHICCPSKGRYFLYKSVRVVFANRVPDGKERLRNETQMPEPRYSAYKPGRDPNTGTTPTADPARRRSAIEPISNEARFAQSLPSSEHQSRQRYDVPMPSLPRHFTALPTLESRPVSREYGDGIDHDSGSNGTASVRSPLSPNSQHGDFPVRSIPHLEDPFNFERDRSRERRNINGNESLLSKRLMDFAFQKHRSRHDEET